MVEDLLCLSRLLNFSTDGKSSFKLKRDWSRFVEEQLILLYVVRDVLAKKSTNVVN